MLSESPKDYRIISITSNLPTLPLCRISNLWNLETPTKPPLSIVAVGATLHCAVRIGVSSYE
jgi:hypothetical protein